MAFEFTPERLAQFHELLTHYPEEHARAAMLPTLHLAQEQNGYLSPDVQTYVAGLLGVSEAQVLDVITFYPMFFDEPVGEHIVRVCRTLPCDLCGCREIIEHIKERLGVDFDETTEDGSVTLLSSECLAACDQAPVMMINDDLHGRLTPERVDELMDALE